MTVLAELLFKGIIKPNTKIFMKKKGQIFNAEIMPDGKIKNHKGEIFKTPSGAAKANNEGKSIDGWTAWRLESNNQTLDSLRN